MLEEIFRANPKTADLIISFNKFADSALNILVVHVWNGTDAKEHFAADAGVEFADQAAVRRGKNRVRVPDADGSSQNRSRENDLPARARLRLNWRMDSIIDFVWHDGKLLGIDWSVWKVVGWLGNAVFSTRFFVQWYATEKKKQVVVPQAFWWLSLVGR